MTDKQIITINGTAYDAHTGLPVAQSSTDNHHQATPAQKHAVTRQHTAAKAIHRKLQKSQTLNRKTVKKHAPKQPVRQLDGIVRTKSINVQQSAAISKFAPKPVVADLPVADLPAQPHPAVARAATTKQVPRPQHTPSRVTPSHAKKESHLVQAIAPQAQAPRRTKKPKRSLKFPKILNIASASFAVLILAGYFTYLNIPSISVRVAAAQAGINASYPDYRPAGYRLNGPIAYDNGQVSIKFAATTGQQSFTIDQQQTNWDSSALLENYVTKRSNNEYVPHQKSGLTIYTFGNDAAWVNGGILYTISGNSQLSDDQVLRIATSM